jgi:two-component system chemotaxis sensor kinase CheA
MSFALEGAMQEFIDETVEMLERIVVNLAQVEKASADKETLNEIYRDMHTIKGSSQLFGCQQMGELAHALEAALEPVRAGTVKLGARLTDITYEGIDVMRSICAELRTSKQEPNVAARVQQLIATLADSAISEPDAPIMKDVIAAPEKVTKATVLVADVKHVEQVTNIAVNQAPEIKVQAAAPAPAIEQVSSHVPVLAASVTSPSKAPPEKSEVKSVQTESSPARSESSKSESSSAAAEGSESIRVQVSLLDSLMNMIGELVLVRNQVIQYTNVRRDAELSNLSQRLNIVTSELQNEVMKTRMQPVGNVLTKFHRVIRDLSRDLNKEIQLKLEGTETELDKTLIEAVKDPLTHIVRNSADHGIETPADRKAAGKSAAGTIIVRSFHEGGQVIIEVSDDGKGLSKDKLSKKALEKGVVSQAQLDRMSLREVHNLIFAPGFSTAEKVTNVSGRGVGMDVVRSNIERIGGSVELNSEEGKGTSIRLKIPLTLAIVPALIVKSHNEQFAIPQVKLVELVRVDVDDPEGVDYLQDRPIFRLRGRLLPLVSLREALKLGEESQRLAVMQKNRTAPMNIAVLTSDGGQFGLVVDSIEDSTDIVVKPLSGFLKDLGVYSGATIMGDGSLALALDVAGLAASARMAKDQETTSTESQMSIDASEGVKVDEAEYLTANIGAEGRFALPLVLVNRLEEFQKSKITTSGKQRIVQYRNQILPLLNVQNVLGFERMDKQHTTAGDKIAVVVVERAGKLFGLEVDSIDDVLTIQANVERDVSPKQGIVGSLIYKDTIITILDAFGLIDLYTGVRPSDNEKNNIVSGDRSIGDQRAKHEILFAEDNTFFRRQVLETLASAGYRVASEINGELALERLKRSSDGEFSVILSDIEMPKMTGLELAAAVRNIDKYKSIPMIALTTKFSKSDQDKGIAMGFNRYLEKLKPHELVTNLDEMLGIKGGLKRGA